MATKTRAEMIDVILAKLGVKATGQSVSAEDSVTCGAILDSVHSRLQRRGLAPFATSAFPEWSHDLFRDIVAARICGEFGITGEEKREHEDDGTAAMLELSAQTTGKNDPRVVTRFEDF